MKIYSKQTNATLAQLVEHLPEEQGVPGSIPGGSTIQCPTGQIGKVISLKRRSSLCSNQR